ncbi:hypothetical protein HK100_012107 [Physocladia obscura]|uniref:TLC domain-containing protein n=1 Tax=Physocladia obscura TaxID=109957 RepID=A0AAD5T093_9FUNG|nr:hypothetical protein HK100_012107 [Physocladia obscura]
MPVDPDSTWLNRSLINDVILQPQFYIPFFSSLTANLAWYRLAEKWLLPFIYGGACVTASSSSSNANKNSSDETRLQKAKSWVSTVFSSQILILGGIPIAIEFLLLDKNETTADLVLRDSSYSWGLGAFFIGFLCADCILGCTSYPKQFNLLTGWIHHSAYACVVFWLICRGQIGVFMPCVSFAEASTFLLALGSVNSKWRTDLGFGVSFFLGRILIQTLVVFYALKTYTGYFWVAPAVPLPLHVHWFYKWSVGYFSAKKKKTV